MSVLVKICGLSTAETVDAAVDAGADLVGFNFFERSPRYAAPETVSDLARHVPEHVRKVGLFVDPSDAYLSEVLSAAPLDVIQLHGSESPERCIEVHDRFRRPVFKALPIDECGDLAAADGYAGIAERVLLDAKPPKGADRPGGNAAAFDWHLLNGWTAPLPWLLAGGLTSENVAEAIRVTDADAVDVSSGVESAPGEKDASMIRAFLAAAKRD